VCTAESLTSLSPAFSPGYFLEMMSDGGEASHLYAETNGGLNSKSVNFEPKLLCAAGCFRATCDDGTSHCFHRYFEAVRMAGNV
jgi:hypothetical protein